MPPTIARRPRLILPVATPVAVAFVVSVALAQSQTKTVVRPKFEVASIKPCKVDNADGRRSGGENLSPGSLHLECSTVNDLIQMAYVLFANGQVNVPWSGSVPIEGGPSWINSDRYEIDAKADGSQSQGAMHGPMLQALLEDRLELKTHRKTREVPVYALVVAKGGHKMRQFKEGSCTPFDFTILTQFPPPPLPELPLGQDYCGGIGSDGRPWFGISITRQGPSVIVEARGISLDDFPKAFLSNRLDRPIVNRTGIRGRFDFRLEFVPDETLLRGDPSPATLADDPATGPSIFTAVQEQLGLKLESAKGPGEFLIIDHVEKPSENSLRATSRSAGNPSGTVPTHVPRC